MKKNFLIATHGQLASGFQNAIKLLADKSESIQVIDAYVTNEDYTPVVTEFIASIQEGEQGVIFTDLFGGSVNQVVVSELIKSKKNQIFVISNSNLAIILTLILEENEKLTAKNIEEMIKESQVRLVNTELL